METVAARRGGGSESYAEQAIEFAGNIRQGVFEVSFLPGRVVLSAGGFGELLQGSDGPALLAASDGEHPDLRLYQDLDGCVAREVAGIVPSIGEKEHQAKSVWRGFRQFVGTGGHGVVERGGSARILLGQRPNEFLWVGAFGVEIRLVAEGDEPAVVAPGLGNLR